MYECVVDNKKVFVFIISFWKNKESYLINPHCRVLGQYSNGVARTIKSYAHQRETTVSSINSLQLCPFSKWTIFRGKNLLPEEASSFLSGSKFFPLRAVSCGMGNRFYHIR